MSRLRPLDISVELSSVRVAAVVCERVAGAGTICFRFRLMVPFGVDTQYVQDDESAFVILPGRDHCLDLDGREHRDLLRIALYLTELQAIPIRTTMATQLNGLTVS